MDYPLECPFYHFQKPLKSEEPLEFQRGLVGSLSAVALPGGGREKGPTERSCQKKGKLWVGRLSQNGNEPRRALPAKASREPISKARLAMCPLDLNFIGPFSSFTGSCGRRTNLGLLGHPQQRSLFPPHCRLTTLPFCQGGFPSFCVYFLCLQPPSYPTPHHPIN